MSPLEQSDSTIIHRFRIPAGHADLLSTRQRVARVLGGATLRPSRLPLSAILFVRKLRDATPVSRISDSNRSQIEEWERSLNNQLDRLAAEAVRVADHPVPASAEAVVFSERAEMLACLALDSLKGSLRTNWWWSTLFASGGADSLLAREWLASPEFVPLALEYLANRSQAVALAQKISDGLAAALLNRVVHVFGIPLPKQSPRQQLDEAASNLLTEEHTLPQPISLPTTPWSPFVPEADAPGLAPLQRVFLAQTLILRRAPSQARAVAFQTALAAWCAAAADQNAIAQKTPGSAPALVAKPATAAVSSPSAAGRATTQLPTTTPRSTTDSPTETRVSGPPNPPPNQPGPASDITEAAPHHELHLPSPLARDLKHAHQLLEADYLDLSALRTDSSQLLYATPTKSDPLRDLPPQARRQVPSELAGVFFLINVALALGLYSDFTAPRGENLEVDLWDFLWLLASRFVRDKIRTDNLNALLAELAGRASGEPAGANFRPPPVREIPASWLREFPEPFTPHEKVLDGQTQLHHPAGFVLRESPDPNASAAQHLQSWADWICAYIRARLARAIGREDAAEFVCRVSANVEVTPMRIDIHYSLQSHPIEIRLAGLDRDPGWIPAAGRYVAYHFH